MSKNSPTHTNQVQCCLPSVVRQVLITIHHISRFPNLIHRLFMAVNLYFGATVAQW